ncbi:MAG: hypothetical protein WA194_02170 [Patescibacteria group bacterium]
MPALFAQIAEIVTNSVDRAAAAMTQYGKDVIAEKELADRSQEVDEVAELLNF